MTIPLKTRVLLADDHAMVRRGLRHVLDDEPDLEVVAEATDGREAIDLALDDEIDLAILDVSMPQLTGLQAARELARRKPELRVLMLSIHDNEHYFFEALRVGASGYVLKSAADRDLVEACRATMRGEPFIYPAAVKSLIRDYLDRAREGEVVPEDPLTRESEIVKPIAEAHSSREIAEMLVISEKTVERHRANILDKLGMHDRVELTRTRSAAGWSSPERGPMEARAVAEYRPAPMVRDARGCEAASDRVRRAALLRPLQARRVDRATGRPDVPCVPGAPLSRRRARSFQLLTSRRLRPRQAAAARAAVTPSSRAQPPHGTPSVRGLLPRAW